MKKIFLSLTVLSVCASLSAGVSFLGYLYPSGGQRGTTVKVIAGGQRIGGRVTLLTETPGIKIKSVMVIPYMGYFQPPQRKWLTQFMKNLYNGKQERPPIPENPEGYTWRKHKWLDEPEKLPLLERSLVAHSLFVRANPLQAAPSIASRLLIELEIAPNAPVGPAKIRLVSGRNISNEKLFFIDDAPQITEPPYYPDFAKKPAAAPAKKFPAVLNGQIMPGETDVFPVYLQKGKQYSFAMCATELSPYLGDCVPGHFQGILTLRNKHGKEVAFADDEYHHPDPVLRFKAPETGLYTLHVSDSIKRGRADFVYRITIKEKNVPYRPYKNQSGYQKRKMVFKSGDIPAVIPAELWEKGLDILGEIRNSKGDTYSIEAKKGDHLIFETFAARLDSPLDTVLVLRDKKGKLIAENDDTAQELDLDLCRRQTDSRLDVTFPADGVYSLSLRSRNTPGKKDHHYTLQICKPEPSVLAVSGTTVLDLNRFAVGRMRFYIQRNNGFKGDVYITSPQLRPVGKNLIPAGKNNALLSFVLANPPRKNQIIPLSFFAEYKVNGKKHSVKVIPAEETMQAFAYTHLLAADRFYCYTIQPPKKPVRKSAGKGKQTQSPKRPAVRK